MTRIITEAGSGKNLLYTHFTTKADLVAAYLRTAADQRLAAALRAAERAGTGPRDQLVAAVEEVASTVQHPRFRGCAFRNYLAEFPDDVDLGTGEHPTPAGVAFEFIATTRHNLDDIVARLEIAPDDADHLAEQLWLLVDGLYLQAAYRERIDDRLVRGAEAAVDLARRIVAAV